MIKGQRGKDRVRRIGRSSLEVGDYDTAGDSLQAMDDRSKRRKRKR